LHQTTAIEALRGRATIAIRDANLSYRNYGRLLSRPTFFRRGNIRNRAVAPGVRYAPDLLMTASGQQHRYCHAQPGQPWRRKSKRFVRQR
jgi:hypothetical protein